MKRITFISVDNKQSALGYPVAGKTQIPEWFKKAELTFKDKNGVEANGLKSCFPFLDAMLSGYFLVTPFDIVVKINEDNLQKMTWEAPPEWNGFVTERPPQMGGTIPRPIGHSVNGLTWYSHWGWKLPRGWSALVTHPHNRYDLPFTTVSGFLESDKFFSNGNLPFFLKEGYEGTIPAGTPFAQIIPIKRSNWVSSINWNFTKKIKYQGSLVHLNKHYYKKFLWVRKQYD